MSIIGQTEIATFEYCGRISKKVKFIAVHVLVVLLFVILVIVRHAYINNQKFISLSKQIDTLIDR